MRPIYRLNTGAEDTTDQVPVGDTQDAGFGISLLPPVSTPPSITATLADVIFVNMTEEIRGSDGSAVQGGGGSGTISTSGSSSLLTSYTSPGAYNVKLVFKGTWTTELQNIFIASADRISQTITADVPAVRVKGVIIDDIQITAELKAIDGAGGILGQAGPTALRSGSYLPATATMQFDSADASNFYGQGLFDEIVTHEMLHSIGFGSIWSYKNLVSGSNFIGANAQA